MVKLTTFFKFSFFLFVSFIISLKCFSADGKPVIAFKIKHLFAYEEGFKPAKLIITRSTKVGLLEVNFKLNADSEEGKEFLLSANKIVFKDGESEAYLKITPQVDYSFKRRDKELKFSILKNVKYNVGNDSVANVTIIQDPSPKYLPSDSVFFSKLDFNNSALETIKSAVASSNYKVARKRLADYYRNRTYPVFEEKGGDFNLTLADEALNNTYSISGLKYNFGYGKLNAIDWSYSVEGNPNWSWEINRFPWWDDLTKAYLKDTLNNKKYGERLFFELRDWLNNSPIDVTIVHQLTAGNRWRHLETGLRLESAWTQAFYKLKNSKLLSDDLLVDWVKGFYQHNRFLEANAELSTNRGFTEANGLYIGSVFFQEFSEAKEWRKLALKRMENVLKSDVNDDGTLKEFSPGYHNVTVGVVEKFINFSKINNLPISNTSKNAYESLLNYYLLAVEPTGTIPLMNDSYKFDVRKSLARGFKNFPDRKDFEFVATNGKSGILPKITSHLFKDANQVVMRSGWKDNDSYLLMDAGPFGTSHGNEDKLSISVDGYGTRHIIDCGPYNYEDTNPYRIYSVSSFGKSIPLVDNLGQNRRAIKSLYFKKTNVTWFTSPQYDYTSASYGLDTLEKLGKDLVNDVVTTRHIFYLKPDVWVLIDDFNPLDKKEHSYTGLFQCNDDEVETNNNEKSIKIQLKPGEFDPFNRVVSKQLLPSLTIKPLEPEIMKLTVIKGQTEPYIAGWQFEKSTSWKKQAIPTVKFETESSKRTQMTYLLSAEKADGIMLNCVIKKLNTTSDTYGVEVSFPDQKKSFFLLIALEQPFITYEGKKYNTKALIVDANKKTIEVVEAK